MVKEPEPESILSKSKYKASFEYSAQMEKILEDFNQVKVNISLIDAIEQVPSYAKFFKVLSQI